MTILVVHVGQCGNQLALRLWPLLHEHWVRTGRGRNAFFSDGKARAVFVDTEPKVVTELLQQDKHNLIIPDNVVHEQCGRGNNWAMGYYGPQWNRRKTPTKRQFTLHSAGGNAEPMASDVVDRTMRRIQREVEKTRGTLDGVLLLHSLAGGTGSGLGCRLTECIHEMDPDLLICSVVVAAFQSGEVPLQNLNATLCLGHLQNISSAIILFSNDEIIALIDPTKRRHVTLADINDYICSCLLQTLNWGQEEGVLKRLATELVRGAQMKLLTIFKYPPVVENLPPEDHLSTWMGFMDRACQRLPKWDANKRRVWTFQAWVTVTTNETANTMQKFLTLVKELSNGKPPSDAFQGDNAEDNIEAATPSIKPSTPRRPHAPTCTPATASLAHSTARRRSLASTTLPTIPTPVAKPTAAKDCTPVIGRPNKSNMSGTAPDPPRRRMASVGCRPSTGPIPPCVKPAPAQRRCNTIPTGNKQQDELTATPIAEAEAPRPVQRPSRGLSKGDKVDVVSGLRKLDTTLNLVGQEEGMDALQLHWRFLYNRDLKVSNASVKREMVICSNQTGVASSLTHVLDRAILLYHAEAYVHWYKRHGATADTFLEAFQAVQTVIDHYYTAQSAAGHR